MPTKTRKSVWTEAYDDTLAQVMKDLGMEQTCQQEEAAHSWSTVQKALAEILEQQLQPAVCINAKQCRDRWLNHLAPGIVKGNWTAEEKDIIVQMATAAEVYSFKEMAERLPGRPCADIKNMYHSLMRSGKIAKSDRPRPVDRTRGLDQQVGQQQQRPQPRREPSQLTPSSSSLSTAEVDRDGTKKHKRKATTAPSASAITTTSTISSSPSSDEKAPSQERPKKKNRPSGIPLVAAPPFASPNTTNAARVLLSLDVTSNSTWPGATTEVTTDSSMDKHPNYNFNSSLCGGWGNNGDTGCTVVSALPCNIDDDHAESLLMSDYYNNSTENVVCKVYIHKPDNNNTNATAGPQLLGFATLPSTHLTFAQARTVLQTELALEQKQWCFTVPGQGRLTLDQESKLRVDFLVTPDALGTISAPLPLALVTDPSCSDQDDSADGYSTVKNKNEDGDE